MLSPPDVALIGVVALLIFGPDQLPKVARRAGQIMREVQNTSQTFIREMEKAADDMDLREAFAHDEPMTGPKPAYGKFDEPSPALSQGAEHVAPPSVAEVAPAQHPVAPADSDHRSAADAAKTPGAMVREPEQPSLWKAQSESDRTTAAAAKANASAAFEGDPETHGDASGI